MSIEYNLFDPAVVDDDAAILKELRQTCPVAEVMPGVLLRVAPRRHPGRQYRHRDLPAGAVQPAGSRHPNPDQLQLGESNPPLHTQIRKLLASVLRPSRIRAMEPVVDKACRDLVDAFAQQGLRRSDPRNRPARCPRSSSVISTGVPEPDRHLLHDYSDDVVAMIQHHDPQVQAECRSRVEKFDAHLLDVIRERRQASERPDDAMTALVDYRDENGRPLPDEKILLHLSKDVITGGIDTTTHLVGNLFYDLLNTPGAYERVRDDRALVPHAVEECLRHRPVVNVLFRRPAADCEFQGVKIPAGSVVALGYSAANHDEALYENPEQFDLDRGDEVRRQLGFGWGPHLCIGAPLARLEGVHVLNAMLDRIPRMRLAPGFDTNG